VRDGYDFVLHVGGSGLLVASERKLLLLAAAHIVFLRERLGSLAHRIVGLRIVRIKPRIGREVEPAHRDARHRFHARADERIARAERYLARRVVDRFHRRAAPAVDRRARHRYRQPRQEHAHPRDVQALLALGKGAAHLDILYGFGIDFRPGDERLYHLRRHVVRPDARKRAFAGNGERGAQIGGNDDAGHGILLPLTLAG
jgi:hypothetical protein